MADLKKYNNMENILQLINRHYVSLPEEEVRRNNGILHQVIEGITDMMCEVDPLFSTFFQRFYYGGSYYDDLKVEHPDEYDIDMLLVFPRHIDVSLITSNKPGFVYAHVNSGLEKFCGANNYLETTKILYWIEGILQKVLNKLPHERYGYNLWNLCSEDLYARFYKNGPAFTFTICGQVDGHEINMDVDLVPCFVFDIDELPLNGFKTNRDKHYGYQFFIVPKKPKSLENVSIYWRLSLQMQERNLIDHRQKVKPALRLLKKMRLSLNHIVDSYYLKTIVLWKIAEMPDDYWLNKSLSFVFMEFLKKYKDCLLEGEIPYFWNKNNNLIESFNSNYCFGTGRQLENIIKEIDKNLQSDSTVAAKYILSAKEYANITEVTKEYYSPESEPETAEDTGRCIIL